MTKRLLLAALAACLLVIPVTASAQITVTITPPSAPPAPRAYVQQAAPAPNYVWVPGYWSWEEQSQQWAWVDGYWIEDQPGYVIVQPEWVNDGGRWVHRRGGWARRGTRHVEVDFDRNRRWRAERREERREFRDDRRDFRQERREDRRDVRQDRREDRREERRDDRRERRVVVRPGGRGGPRVIVRPR